MRKSLTLGGALAVLLMLSTTADAGCCRHGYGYRGYGGGFPAIVLPFPRIVIAPPIIYAPPVVVAPPVIYAEPPVVYAPPVNIVGASYGYSWQGPIYWGAPAYGYGYYPRY